MAGSAGSRKLTESGLTAQEELFVREYMVDYNGTQAAIRAGFAERGARSKSTALLTREAVITKLRAIQALRVQNTELRADRVVQELARIAFCDVGDLYGADGALLPVRDMPEAARRCVKSLSQDETYEMRDGVRTFVGYTTKVTLWPKMDAINTAMKHLGMLKEQVEVTGKLTLEQLVLASMEAHQPKDEAAK